MTKSDLDTMAAAWIEAALFTAPEEAIPPKSGEFDASPHLGRVTKAFKAEAAATCRAFFLANAADLAEYPADRAGHDLWYTTNRHGCGYWEGDHCDKATGERLTAAAHKLPERNVYRQRGWYGIE